MTATVGHSADGLGDLSHTDRRPAASLQAAPADGTIRIDGYLGDRAERARFDAGSWQTALRMPLRHRLDLSDAVGSGRADTDSSQSLWLFADRTDDHRWTLYVALDSERDGERDDVVIVRRIELAFEAETDQGYRRLRQVDGIAFDEPGYLPPIIEVDDPSGLGTATFEVRLETLRERDHWIGGSIRQSRISLNETLGVDAIARSGVTADRHGT